MRKTCCNFFFLKVFLIETDGRLFVWIGKDASSKEKQNAMSYAQVSDEATFHCYRIKSWNVWKGSTMNAKELIFFCDTFTIFCQLTACTVWQVVSQCNLLEREDMRLFDLKWFYNYYLITTICARKVFKKNSLGLEKTVLKTFLPTRIRKSPPAPAHLFHVYVKSNYCMVKGTYIFGRALRHNSTL